MHSASALGCPLEGGAVKEHYEPGEEHERPADKPPAEAQPASEDVSRTRNDAREAKRAAVYGLQLDHMWDQSIVVSAGKSVRLSGLERTTTERGLVRLQPKDLHDVKRWIGVPDELAGKRSCCNALPAELPGLASAKDYRRLDANAQKAVRDLAHEYVYGDSRRVAPYKSILDAVVDRATVTGIFVRQDIEIHTGAVLEIAKNVKVLFARHIRIWRGGLLRLKGATKVDCVSITGGLQSIAVTLDHLPPFATYFVEGTPNG